MQRAPLHAEFTRLVDPKLSFAGLPLARITERGEQERVEAAEVRAGMTLAAQLDRIAERTRDLVADLEALRLRLDTAPTAPSDHAEQ